jgi:endonuclease/exonuclease/phosphatase (EEP) superfamily protein YafD
MNNARKGCLHRYGVAFCTLYVVLFGVYLIGRAVWGDGVLVWAIFNNAMLWGFAALAVITLLAVLLRAPRVVALGFVLLVIGLVHYGPRWTPKTVTPSDDTFTAVSLNILAANDDFARVEDVIRQLDADVLVLQEVTDTAQDILIPVLNDLYPYQTTAETAEPPTMARALVLSKFAFAEPPQVFEPYARVVLNTGERQLAFYGVHLSWPFTPISDDMPFVFSEHRDYDLTRLLAQADSETLPTLILGDVNVSDDSPAYDRFAAMGWYDAQRTIGVGLGLTWGPIRDDGVRFAPKLLRLDYAFYREGLRPVSIESGPPTGSDHRPLVVRMARD